MSLSDDSRTRLETVVADAVWAVRDQAEQQGTLAQFHEELRAASHELIKLSRGENCDYDLPRMGEAYALWYHMRRVSQIYEALEKFPRVATPLTWDNRPLWRVLDIGAGTGAGAMALSRWVHDGHGLDAVGRTTVDCLEPAAPMVSMGIKALAQMADAGLPVASTRWLNAGLGDDAHFAGAGYHLILCSTTFDYLEEATWEGEIHKIADFLDRHLVAGGSVVFLAPNRGFDGEQQGPKVRFVEELISRAGLQEYRKKVKVQPYRGLQTPILAMRMRLNQDARRAGAGFGLGDGAPDYTTDTFSYGVYRPRSS